jgi:hypothetical protein
VLPVQVRRQGVAVRLRHQRSEWCVRRAEGHWDCDTPRSCPGRRWASRLRAPRTGAPSPPARLSIERCQVRHGVARRSSARGLPAGLRASMRGGAGGIRHTRRPRRRSYRTGSSASSSAPSREAAPMRWVAQDLAHTSSSKQPQYRGRLQAVRTSRRSHTGAHVGFLCWTTTAGRRSPSARRRRTSRRRLEEGGDVVRQPVTGFVRHARPRRDAAASSSWPGGASRVLRSERAVGRTGARTSAARKTVSKTGLTARSSPGRRRWGRRAPSRWGRRTPWSRRRATCGASGSARAA